MDEIDGRRNFDRRNPDLDRIVTSPDSSNDRQRTESHGGLPGLRDRASRSSRIRLTLRSVSLLSPMRIFDLSIWIIVGTDASWILDNLFALRIFCELPQGIRDVFVFLRGPPFAKLHRCPFARGIHGRRLSGWRWRRVTCCALSLLKPSSLAYLVAPRVCTNQKVLPSSGGLLRPIEEAEPLRNTPVPYHVWNA